MSGLSVSVSVGTSRGNFKITTEYRRSHDGWWNKDLVLGMVTSLKEYICPSASPSLFVIVAGDNCPGIAPEVAEEDANTRRVRLVPCDFFAHGYTGGCP